GARGGGGTAIWRIEKMSDLPEINRRAVALLREPPNLGVERFHGAADDYFRIAPQVRTLIEGMSVPGQLSPENHHSYRLLLLKLVSLECAAGAPAARC